MELKRVLIIDQMENIRKALITILHLEGYHAIGAASFSEARTMIKKRNISLILTDTEEIVSNGGDQEFFSWLKRRNPRIPLIIMSDSPLFGGYHSKIEEAADGFVWKPLKIQDVKKIIGFVKNAE